MGDGKMQPLTQVCSPHSLKVACTCAGGTKGPFSVTSLGPALAPPVSEQPASAPSAPSGSRGPHAATRPLHALFSLAFWASGSFFLQILPKFCRLKTPLMQPKGRVNNPPRWRSSCLSRG